jgi:hypothetical protein
MMKLLPSSGVTTLEKSAEKGVDLDTTEKRNWLGLMGDADEEKANGEMGASDFRGDEVGAEEGDDGLDGEEEGEDDVGEAETSGSSRAGREKGKPRLAFLSAEGGKRRLATEG